MPLNVNATTFSYKHILASSRNKQEINVHLDVYPPAFISHINHPTAGPTSVPAVIYFHGGGLTVGNRQSWFPTWLHKRVTDAGYAFVSADYQLLPPATGHDVVQDIQDVLVFVTSREFALGEGTLEEKEKRGSSFRVDPESIAVAGSSAGGLCAYLAAIHCVSPKPQALLSMYGMGADFFSSHYLSIKTKPFFRGREILNPSDFKEYLHPNHNPDAASTLFASLAPIANSALAYHPQTYHIPGYPANPRMLLSRLYLQLGVFIDYYTGEHDGGGLSVNLRDALRFKPSSAGADGVDTTDIEFYEHIRALVPTQHQPLFPQLNVSSNWPPTMLVHGTEDTAVPIYESRSLKAQLERAGVYVELCEVEGREHSFDYEPGAEELFGEGVFDVVGGFLGKYVGRGVRD